MKPYRVRIEDGTVHVRFGRVRIRFKDEPQNWTKFFRAIGVDPETTRAEYGGSDGEDARRG